MTEKLLTIEEVARYLGLSEEAVKGLVEKGDLPGYKIGGVILRFKKEQVENYCKRRDADGVVKNVLSEERTAKGGYADRQRVWTERKRPSESTHMVRYTFWERLEDFLYYNDFYILSLILLILILLAIFKV